MSDTLPFVASLALCVGFLLGIYAENWATNKNAEAIRERRLRRLLADLRNPHPLLHRVKWYEATSERDAIELLLSASTRVEEEA